MTKRETSGVASSLSKVIWGNIGSVPGLPYIWNYCRNHSDDISYWGDLIPMKSGLSGGHRNKRGKSSRIREGSAGRLGCPGTPGAG